MTVNVSHALQHTTPFHGQVNSRGFSEFAAGQIVSVKVLRRLDEQHYVVELRGQTREVQSEHALPVGDTIDAVVVSAADKLELRQLTGDLANPKNAAQAPLASLAIENQTDIVAQANFYKCKLDKLDLRTLQKAVETAKEPSNMVLAGLFLSKRGMPVDPLMLQQLYAVQTAPATAMASVPATPDLQQNNKEAASTLTVADLAQAMRTVVEIHAGEMMASVAAAAKKTETNVTTAVVSDLDEVNASSLTMQMHGTDVDDVEQNGDNNRKPASISALHDLLSDVDANGLGVRYGTLPVLINGQLVELELMLVKHRPKETDAEPVKRLVMSIHTQGLGTVSITAEALNEHLLINISAEKTEYAETLGNYANDVRALAERFGWSLQSVAYDVKTHSAKLAQRVMEHSIRQGVIDHVW